LQTCETDGIYQAKMITCLVPLRVIPSKLVSL
jgi:hypothetical protein